MATAGPTPPWSCNWAVSPRPQFWVWRVQRDELWGESEGPAGRRTEEAHPLKEGLHPGGKEEEEDQTRVADWHPEQLVSTMEVSPWRVRRDKGYQTAAGALEELSYTVLLWWRIQRRGLQDVRGPDPRLPDGTAAGAGGDGGDVSSLLHLWAAGRSVSSDDGAPRPAGPPPGRR